MYVPYSCLFTKYCYLSLFQAAECFKCLKLKNRFPCEHDDFTRSFVDTYCSSEVHYACTYLSHKLWEVIEALVWIETDTSMVKLSLDNQHNLHDVKSFTYRPSTSICWQVTKSATNHSLKICPTKKKRPIWMVSTRSITSRRIFP